MEVSKFTIRSTIKGSVASMGIWYGDDKNKVNTLGKVGISLFIGIYLLQWIELVMAKGEAERFFECASVICFCGMGVFKLYSLHCNRDIWQNILEKMILLEDRQTNMAAPVEEYESDNENSYDHHYRGKLTYTEDFRITFNILDKLYKFTVVMHVLSPLIEYSFKYFLGHRDSLEYPHILPNWNPLSERYVPCYILSILFETGSSLFCVLVHEAFDLTVIGILIFVRGQFALLFISSSRIGGKGGKCNLSKKRDARAHRRIIECHRTHLFLVKIIKDLDSLLKNVLGLYFFLSTLTLCSVAVRLSSEDLSTMQIIYVLQYMCATLTQLFLFCTYGDAVVNQSSVGQGEGPFASAVWCLSPKIRREVLLLGKGMSTPRRLHAGPFNTVDLPTFIQIIRAAYSYYAVLGSKS